MKLITLNVPVSYLKDLDLLVKLGFYPNRSEAIRLAIRDLLLQHGFAPWPLNKLKDPVERFSRMVLNDADISQ
jgi:Arc/MetJ-type ribon-helix-helix transcriptional regulator